MKTTFGVLALLLASGCDGGGMAFNNQQLAEWGTIADIPPNPVVGLRGQSVRLANLGGDTPSSEMVTVAIQSQPFSLLIPGNPPIYQAGGPLIGIVEFSTGGGGGFIEFDVPVNATLAPNQPEGGGGG